MPMKCTACWQAVATTSACGSASPTSSAARITIRRTMNSGSSPALDHPRQPVERRVRVRPAHRLDERGDRVVVVVALLVVVRPPVLQRLRDIHRRDRRARPRASATSAAISSAVSAARAIAAGALEQRRRASSSMPRPRRRAHALRPPALATTIAEGVSGASCFSRMTRTRLSSGATTSNDGFSVVAPISVTVPSST